MIHISSLPVEVEIISQKVVSKSTFQQLPSASSSFFISKGTDGNYNLVDNGYSNGEGFLSPYRGVRYHLKEWDSGGNAPHNQEEYFNMKHAGARNVIKRTSGLLKTRWVVLRSPLIMEDDEGMFLRRRGGKCAKGSRRVWSTIKEETLLDCSRDIVRNGCKCDNEFHTGYLGVLEHMICKQLLRCGLKSDPHISSKIHVWKRTYGSLSNMMGCSGFGWNETSHMIVIFDDVFESYLKSIWCEVFGKARAMGQHAVDFENASNNVSEECVPVSPKYYVPNPDPTIFAD
ncbi:hypothetical protein Sango_2086200 [Sesamum angolense]|uniref:DDE Tnp4 domain-containing protein n=1 Tax=Sesamum angolense TaxID=2727404 RepID=A0AAE2BLY3_9LAMI|nr:hypothetical protein Sango_2086200 [Sesamum angolense]